MQVEQLQQVLRDIVGADQMDDQLDRPRGGPFDLTQQLPHTFATRLEPSQQLIQQLPTDDLQRLAIRERLVCDPHRRDRLDRLQRDEQLRRIAERLVQPREQLGPES